MLSANKRYLDDIAKSGEYLRQALPLMSKQPAGLHPISYTIWYEYVSGINPPLTQAIDEMLARGEVLDNAATDRLYRRFIAEISEEDAERISSGFNRVISEISKTASEAGSQANRFGDSLERWSEDLNSGDETAMTEGIHQLIGDTKSMQEAVSSLKEQLDASQREIQDLKKEVMRAREDSLQDGLTGLVNRRGFDLVLEQTLTELTDASEQLPCILIGDIDHFKKINDSFGHLFGDKVIRAVAQVLQKNTKSEDVAARYGGEEFILLMKAATLEEAIRLAESIRHMVENSKVRRSGTNESVATVTLSLGVARFISGESAADFIGRADQALYSSKAGGRNRVSIAKA